MADNQYRLLKAMQFKTGQTSQQLADELGLQVFQITAVLKSLEKKTRARCEVKRGARLWFKLVTAKEAKSRDEKAAADRSIARNLSATIQERQSQLDENVRRIDDTRGWKVVDHRVGELNFVRVYTDLEGKSYEQAEPLEPCDLIRTSTTVGLPDFRFRLLRKSSSTYAAIMRYRERVAEVAG